MNERQQLRKDFIDWFTTWVDPNIGIVEAGTQRVAAWAAWCEQYNRQLAQDALDGK